MHLKSFKSSNGGLKGTATVLYTPMLEQPPYYLLVDFTLPTQLLKLFEQLLGRMDRLTLRVAKEEIYLGYLSLTITPTSPR